MTVATRTPHSTSRFSTMVIHWVHAGVQTVAWGGRQLSLDPDGYLIVNRAGLVVVQSSLDPPAQAISVEFAAEEVAQVMRRMRRIVRLLSELSPCEMTFSFTEYVRSIDSVLGTRLSNCFKAGALAISAEEKQSLLLDAVGEEVELRRRAQRIPATKPTTRTDLLTKILHVGDFLMSHHGLSSSMGEVASLADLSPYYLSRLFKLVYGVPPNAFRTQKRIRAAMRLLAVSGTRSRVASEVGFGHRTTLFRHMRKNDPQAGGDPRTSSKTNAPIRQGRIKRAKDA